MSLRGNAIHDSVYRIFLSFWTAIKQNMQVTYFWDMFISGIPLCWSIVFKSHIPVDKFATSHIPLQRHHNGHHGILNHQPYDCLLNCLFICRSKKTSKFCVTWLCVGNSPVTEEFPTQRASKARNVSIWWRHHTTSWDFLGHTQHFISMA